MANREHFERMKQGTDVWNSWKEQHPKIQADLSGADLHNIDLSKTNLTGANLSQTNLTGANLDEADLSDADLSGAEMIGAEMNWANLVNANLSNVNLFGASFFGADLSGADLSGAEMSYTDLSEADLSEADLHNTDLSGARLVRTNFTSATLVECNIYGISAWDIQLDGAEQLNLTITPEDQSIITVDNLKVAQFIYLLLNNKEIRDVINILTMKSVLILGRFTPKRKAVLDAIRVALRKHNYLPILFDFDQPSTQTVRETVKTLAHLSHFIIADLTRPSSVQLELETIVPDISIAVQPILGVWQKREFSMYSSLSTRYHWVLPIYRYSSQKTLLASLEQHVLMPAEQKAQELMQELKKK